MTETLSDRDRLYVEQGVSLGECLDPRHETPCGLPCAACEEECDD